MSKMFTEISRIVNEDISSRVTQYDVIFEAITNAIHSNSTDIKCFLNFNGNLIKDGDIEIGRIKVDIINKNIKERRTLISNISTEINELDNEVDRLNQEKRVLENRLTILKKDYARLLQEQYINRSIYSKLMFVLSPESFDQSYRRLRYLAEYQEYRKSQVRKIEGIKLQIGAKSDSLNKNKKTKVEVVKQKEAEAVKLSSDEKKEKQLLTDLKKKENKLRTYLS